MNPNWEELCRVASREVEATLAVLPKPLRIRAEKLAVTFEHQPNAGLQADGIEPDTLGLFTGAEFAEDGNVPLPPQIILFLENLGILPKGMRRFFEKKCGQPFCMNWGTIWDWTKMK